jgi:5-methyltetrahydrofolate--homocysteine methyltransferase
MEISEVYRLLAQYIEESEPEPAVEETRRLIAAGHTASDLFDLAIVPCMTDIGDRFSNLELFLPDMIRAADVVKQIHVVLAETMTAKSESYSGPGTIVLGTVQGDVHDIGKNIVAIMLEVNGFKVVDLGVNVASQEFIKRAREADAKIIALSSLMTTSIPYMEDTIKLIRHSPSDCARFRILVGGGPLTAELAEKMGADGFGEDAADAVRQAHKLLEMAQ